MEKSVGSGVGIGAASGITTAQIAGYNTKGNVVLGLSGAVIGGMIGALLHKEPSQMGETSSAPSGASLGGSPPLRPAEKDVMWIPDRIVGDKFEERHRIWTIKKPAHWQHYPQEQDKQPQVEPEDDNE
jgi:hypothetical protein